MKLLSVVTACYNEEGNVRAVYEQVKQVMAELPGYAYEHIFIDNASTDRTVPILRELCRADPNVKVIVNASNFGHIRSPFHALLQAKGDAVICLVADLQDPPAMVKDFVRKWEEGFRVVVGIKDKSEESPVILFFRNMYYRTVQRLASITLIERFTGFGLYDRSVMDALRRMEEPYPYFRGLISEVGFEAAKIPYKQPARKQGRTKNNFYTLLDMALLGLTSYSKLPLRIATLTGFFSGIVTLLVALFYFIYKIVFWHRFELGLAPLVVGIFFFASVQLFFLGIVGEYIGSIHTYVQRRPLVVERERINF